MLLIGSSELDALLNLIKEKYSDNLIDKTYLYAEDLNKPRYQFLIEKPQEAGMHLNDSKTFIEYWAYMDDFYNNIDHCNPTKNMNLYRKFTSKPYPFLTIDTTSTANNSFRF